MALLSQNDPGMLPRTTVEWILRRDDHDVTCTRRETDRGIELSVTFRGLPVAACVTDTLTCAAAWIHSRRESWEAAGWRLAPTYEITPRRTA